MKQLFDYIKSKVDDAELYKKTDDILKIEIKQDMVKAVDGKALVGLSLRMNSNGCSGTAVSTSEEDLSILDRAVMSSRYNTGDVFTFDHQEAVPVQCYDENLVNMSSTDVIEMSQKLSERLKAYGPDVTFQISVERVISHVEMMNTKGLDDAYKKSLLKISIATISESGFIQNAYTETYSKYFEISDETIRDIVEKHRISNTIYEVETKRMPVVFSGKAMGALMTRLLAGVNGELIAKGVSPLAESLEHQIGAELLNVSDQGNLSGGFATMKFDDEGMPTKTTSLIEKGVLKSFLNTVATKEKVQGPVTGNAQKKTMFSKEIEDQPAIDSTNFMIHPGDQSDEEIIKSIDYGIYVDSVMGTHTGNIPAGEYALNVNIGYLIQGGKLVGKVVDSMVSGNIYEDLFKIKAIGQKLSLMHVVFYSMGYSPMVKFDDINVVGTL